MRSRNFPITDDSRRLVPHTGTCTAFPNMVSLRLGIWGVCFTISLLFAHPTIAAQELEYGKEATIDQHGNIYVSSDEGKLIKVADTWHCSEEIPAPDRQTFGCRVRGPLQPDGRYWESRILEIYRKGGQRTTIEPGGQIGEWHFWKDGRQVAVCSYPTDGPEIHLLYDAATGQLIEKLTEPSDDSLLPQWAKDRLQIESESVPMSPELAQERTKWISKVLWQVGKIKPGMQRKDLLKVFTPDGGIYGRRYVLIECRYIEIDVEFKAGSNGSNEDIIESVSRPYLDWAILD